MQPILTAEQMRQVDRLTVENYALPSLLLMEAAASACLKTIASTFDGRLPSRTRILCGRGNNGGDGAALARALLPKGVLTEVILFGKVDDTAGDARANFEAVRNLSGADSDSRLTFIECETVDDWGRIAEVSNECDLIVDALFGTGLSRPLEGIWRDVVVHLNKIKDGNDVSRPLILSIDVPSGLNADLGELIGDAVKADVTVTFTAPKLANVLPPAAHLCGELVVADIGSPAKLVEGVGSNVFLSGDQDARTWLRETRYEPDSHKNIRGHVLVVAGSRGYTGAAALCGSAAMRSGAGLVTIAAPVSAQQTIAASALPEVITTALAETDLGTVSEDAVSHVKRLAKKATVVAIGPGLTASDDRTRRFVHSIVKERTKPQVIDADGLNCLAPWPDEISGTMENPLILTPHPGEMLRLIGATDISALRDRVRVVREFAAKHNVILVLKGSRSLIGAPDGRVFVNPTGNSGLGKAGSGDTLTGLIAGFVAQTRKQANSQMDALDATIAALYIGGLAGDLAAHEIGQRAMVASDVREHFQAAFDCLNETV